MRVQPPIVHVFRNGRFVAKPAWSRALIRVPSSGKHSDTSTLRKLLVSPRPTQNKSQMTVAQLLHNQRRQIRPVLPQPNITKTPSDRIPTNTVTARVINIVPD